MTAFCREREPETTAITPKFHDGGHRDARRDVNAGPALSQEGEPLAAPLLLRERDGYARAGGTDVSCAA
jgi:hypothetical protein